MIEAKDIGLTLGGKQILRGAQLTAQPGHITALLGRNGSGKTSLLRCLAGTQGRYTGTVALDGQDVRRLSPARRARRISLLPQTLPRPAVTAAQLACYGRTPWAGAGGRLSEADRAAAAAALARVGLADKAGQLVCHLSGGERQLAFLAMLLAQDTPAVLLDEPTASLDVEYRRAVYRLLGSLRSGGRTVVVTLHDLSDAVELADRLVVLDAGRTVFCGTPAAFLEGEVPRRVFGVAPVAVQDRAGRSYTLLRPLP